MFCLQIGVVLLYRGGRFRGYCLDSAKSPCKAVFRHVMPKCHTSINSKRYADFRLYTQVIHNYCGMVFACILDTRFL